MILLRSKASYVGLVLALVAGAVLAAALLTVIATTPALRSPEGIAGLQSLVAEAATFGWRCGHMNGTLDECAADALKIISGKVQP